MPDRETLARESTPFIDEGEVSAGSVKVGFHVKGNDRDGWRWEAWCLFDYASGCCPSRVDAMCAVEDFVGHAGWTAA